MDVISSYCSAQSIGPANQLLSHLIQIILSAHCAISPSEMWPQDYGSIALENGFQEYDFIVIGSGSAGSPIASRLSENKNWKILLLEAGGDPPIESEIPALFGTLQKTKFDWEYYSEGRKGMSNGNYWPRGKILGGTSSINGGVYIRGNPKDFNDWQQMGNTNWNWENVLKYFKKSEDNRTPDIAADVKNHGTNGPIKISAYESLHPAKRIFSQSLSDLGYNFTKDFNGDQYIGQGISQSAIFNGVRWSTAKGYLIPAKNRTNFHIIKMAHVTKIDFNSDHSIAGVHFIINGTKKLYAKAMKEVILSAGVINSPQILMNSGIGPRKHLEELNINVIQDLPVGYNLQDHIIVPYLIAFQKKFNESVYSLQDKIQEYFNYLLNQTGSPLIGLGSSHFMAAISTVNDLKYPDIHYHYYYSSIFDQNLYKQFSVFGYDESIKLSIAKANKNYNIASIAATLLKPKSMGRIILNSTNPFAKPIIQTNYLTNSNDIDTIIRSIRILQKLLTTETFQREQIVPIKINLPECDILEEDSDEYWKCYAIHMASSLFHPTGTVRMGPPSDPRSVVDPMLKVIGIKGLRVADASIMPNIVSGNTNGPTIMIGEKAADLIKSDWLNNVHDEF